VDTFYSGRMHLQFKMLSCKFCENVRVNPVLVGDHINCGARIFCLGTLQKI
jgi:hypothetical protein